MPVPENRLEEQAIALWYRGVAPQPNHWRWVTALAFSPDRPLLLSGAFDVSAGIVVWNWRKRRREWYCSRGMYQGGVAFANRGRVACWPGSDTPHLRFVDIATGQVWVSTTRMKTQTRAVAADPAGEQVAAAEEFGYVHLWRATTRELLRILETPSDYPALELKPASEPDGRTTMRSVPENRSIAFSPDGKRIAAGGAAGLVRLWDAGTGVFLQTYRIPAEYTDRPNPVIAVSFRPEGLEAALTRMVVEGSAGRYDLLLWNVESGSCRVIKGQKNWGVGTVAYSPDGRYVAAGFGNGFVRVYANEKTPRVVMVLPGGGGMRQDIGYPTALAFAPDSRHLAIGTTGPSLNIWSVSEPPEPRLVTSLPVWQSVPPSTGKKP